MRVSAEARGPRLAFQRRRRVSGGRRAHLRALALPALPLALLLVESPQLRWALGVAWGCVVAAVVKARAHVGVELGLALLVAGTRHLPRAKETATGSELLTTTLGDAFFAQSAPTQSAALFPGNDAS